MFREMVIEIDKTEGLLSKLAEADYKILIAAMTPQKREIFLFGRELNVSMANLLRPLVTGDKDLVGHPTSMTVWDTAKRLFPHFEEAFAKPLDRSKYVGRDLRKAPRRHTS